MKQSHSQIFYPVQFFLFIPLVQWHHSVVIEMVLVVENELEICIAPHFLVKDPGELLWELTLAGCHWTHCLTNSEGQ
jgi:hypothetical protein